MGGFRVTLSMQATHFKLWPSTSPNIVAAAAAAAADGLSGLSADLTLGDVLLAS